MPLSSNSQIVGAGANLVPITTAGSIPKVVDVGPPGALNDSIMRQWADAAVQVIAVGPTNVRAGVGATETFRLDGGFISEGAGADSVVIGRAASATQTGVIAIGLSALASGADTLSIGSGSRSTSQGNVALGFDAEATAGICIAIGSGSRAQTANSIAIGQSASANGGGGTGMAMAIGYLAVAGNGGVANYASIAIGNSANAARGGIAIGLGALAEGTTATTSGNLALGHGAQARNNNGQNIVIGSNTTIGSGATAATNCVVIGTLNSLAGAAINRVVVIGSQFTVPNVANTAWFGTPGTNLQTLVFGAGDILAGTAARTIRFTNADGNNDVAGNVTFIAARSTGNVAGASFLFQFGVPVASGATLHTLHTGLTLGNALVELRPATIGRLRNPANSANVVEWGADTLGFYNVAPTTRQTVPLGSTTDTLLTALATLGLIAL